MRLSRTHGAKAPLARTHGAQALHVVSLAVSLVFLSNSALAQKKPKKSDKPEGPSAAATWTDPTESEKSDKGPYTPHKDESNEPAPPPRKAPDKGRTRDKIQVFGQLVIGFGRVPLNQPSYEPGDKGTAFGFMLGGRYDTSKELSIGLRIPITTGTRKQANGVNVSSTVFGAPELFGEYRLSLNKLTTLPIGFGLGIPVAQGSPDMITGTDTAAQQKGFINALADATSGWRDSELYQPKHLPIIVSGGIHHERQDWELHGDLKFVVSPALGTKVADPSTDAPNNGTYKINGLALREVTTLGGSYNFVSSPLFYGALDLALVWTPLHPFVWEAAGGGGAKPTTIQAVLEPRIGARFGLVSPSISYIAPLGGRLGDAKVAGIRLNVSAYF